MLKFLPRKRIPWYRIKWLQKIGVALGVLPYVGGRGGDAGRKTRPNCGLIGNVVADGAGYTYKRLARTTQSFRKALVSDFGYSPEEAAALRDDRWSYLGLPIFDPGDDQTVIAVIYMDSSEPDFFDDDVPDRLERITEGINDYLKRRGIRV